MSEPKTIRVLGSGGDYEDHPNPKYVAASSFDAPPGSVTGSCPLPGHAFAGQFPDGRVPDGWPCLCGAAVSIWKRCNMGHDHLVSESLNDETERSAGSLHPAGSASAWTSQIAGLEERVDKLRGDAYRAKRYDLSAPLQDVKRALYKIRVQEMKTPNAESSEPGAKTNDRPMARNSKPTTATGSARRSRRSSSSNVILFAGTAVAQSTLKEAIVRLMARCGPKDTWKRNEKPHLFDAIIELSNLLDGHFTTEEAIEVGDRIGVSLRPPNEKGQP